MPASQRWCASCRAGYRESGVYHMPTFNDAHALIIGIAKYQRLNRLPEVKDAQDIRDLLVDPAQGGYAAGNVELLTDERATQAAMRQAFVHLAQRTKRDSTAFIYFSGHGGHVESGPQAG